MNAADYRRLLKSGIRGAYLFFGKEEYMKRFCLTETRKSITDDITLATFNIMRFSGADSEFSFGRIAGALSSPPVFCNKKLIELHDLDIENLNDESFDELERLTAAASESEDCIFIIYTGGNEFDAGTEKRRTKTYERLTRMMLTAVEFDYETPAKLIPWLIKHFSAGGIAAGAEQCGLLIRRCGTAMDILSGEAAKLCAFIHAKGRSNLTEDDIEAVTCAVTEDEEFALSNAVLSGEPARAFAVMRELKAKKEKPELILAGISGVLCGIKLVSVLSAAGMSVRDIAQKTKIHEYRVGLYQKSLRQRGFADIDRLLDLCAETDYKIKSTGLDSYMLIDRLIAAFSTR